MKRPWLYPAVIVIITIIFFLAYCREQQHARKILSENQRLWNENRDLRRSLTLTSGTAQQIAERKDMQQHVQGRFVERRTYYRRNWQQFISVAASDYKTGFLGGIKNLQVIVRNQTEYPIDNVVVSVMYLRNNDEVFKTEQYTIHNIPEKGVQTVNASNSRKGSKVKLKLVSITSQAMNFCWTAGKQAPVGDPDPWQCVPQPPK